MNSVLASLVGAGFTQIRSHILLHRFSMNHRASIQDQSNKSISRAAKFSTCTLVIAMRMANICAVLLVLLLFTTASVAAVTRDTFRWTHNTRCSSTPAPAVAEEGQFRVIHKHGICSPYGRVSGNSTWLDTVHRMIANDKHRQRYIRSRLNGPVDTRVHSGHGNFLVEAALGTPPQKFVGDMDTGSDVLWVSCIGCTSCNDNASALFNPKLSSSGGIVACDDPRCSGQLCYRHTGACILELFYGDETQVLGTVFYDTLALGGGAKLKNFVFMCAWLAASPNVELTSGLVGLGRENTSLVSQTAARYGKRFSYCLPSYFSESAAGRLTLGAPSAGKNDPTTALLLGKGTTYYFVALDAVSVDGESVPIPADSRPDGGTIVDSGTSLTHLLSDVYERFSDVFVRKARSYGLRPVPKEEEEEYPCFHLPRKGKGKGDRVRVPQVALHFDGGATVVLTEQQTLFPDDKDGSVMCLAFSSTKEGPAIIGNYQQQDMLVTYDLANAKISFSHKICR